MKLLCLLFALFVLIFSARPCCADRDCDESGKKHQQDAHHPVKEKECPGCSPFFSCGSCVGFIEGKPVLHSIALIAEMHEQNYVSYIYPGLKEVALAIWQPPQIS